MYEVSLWSSYFPAQADAKIWDTTVGVHLREVAVDHPDLVAMVEIDDAGQARGKWTYSNLLVISDRLARSLASRFAPGEKVVVWAPNIPEWIFMEYACGLAGLVLVTANPSFQAKELRYVLEQSGAVALFMVDEFRGNPMREIAENATASVEGIREVINLNDEAALHARGDLEGVLPAVAPDDAAQIQYTSGTTGNPKGAVSTHRGVLSALMAFACGATVTGARRATPSADGAAPVPAPSCFILIVPLFHVTGCVAVMLSCWLGGARLVMTYKWDPERALQLIEREKVTHFIGVPTQSWDLLECENFGDYDTSSLTNVGGGGAPAPPELVKRIDGSFKKGRPGIGYGMTETNAYGPQNGGDDYMRKPTSAGRTIPIVEMASMDDQGNKLGPDEVGELCFRGPNLIRGYWNKPEATAETIVNGWLRSGDIGRIDTEGFVYVQDRAKDMVLRGGENIYCAEVEAAIYEFPAVYEAAVFGLPHERLGEEVAVAIYPREGQTFDEEELRSFLGQSLASFKIPAHVHVATEPLPRNASGKILKRDLRDRLQALRA